MTLNEWFKQANFKGYKMAPLVSSGKYNDPTPFGPNLKDVFSLSFDDREKVIASWAGYDDMPKCYDPKLRRRLRDKLRRDNKPEHIVMSQLKLPLENDDPVRKVLNDIDEVLKNNTPAARDLWMILSALRGPDADGSVASVAAKDTFTCFIRSKAFPKTAEAKKNGDGGVNYPQFSYSPGYIDPQSFSNLDFHYKQHLNSATEAMARRKIVTKDECPEQIRPEEPTCDSISRPVHD